MAIFWKLWFCAFALTTAYAGRVQVSRETLEESASSFLQQQNLALSQVCSKFVHADWAYQTSLSDESRLRKISRQVEFVRVKKEVWQKVKKWEKMQKHLKDENLKRQFKVLSVLGTAALPQDDLTEYARIISDMSSIYNTATVCSFHDKKKCDLTLNEDLKAILRGSRDSEQLKYVWKEWRKNTGKKMRNNYRKLVPLLNKAAVANGFKNKVEMDLDVYEIGHFREEMASLWKQLKPLYQQLHSYVRRKLREVYKISDITERGPIPAHLLGNMWAQQWDIFDLLVPYPEADIVDTTEEMKEKGFTSKKIFELADDFFASLNMSRVPLSFWEDSVLEKPKEVKIICNPSAWDFCDGENFRVKQCTEVRWTDFLTANHQMGHIQYFMQYKNQPYIFHRSANPAFHEAIGDLGTLSVSTTKYLKQIGLLQNFEDTKETDINFLMKMALEKVVYLPYAYMMDMWRWKVLDGTYPEKDWNCEWWDLRYELQGVKPPIIRTEEDFDPAAKFLAAVNAPYIRYFLSTILQFQFHKALCIKSGGYDAKNSSKPLHKCNIHGSAIAGNAFSEMLKLGSSKPWPEAISGLTGEEIVSTAGILEYFRPLETWLREDNKKHKEFVGWRPDGQYCLYKALNTTSSCSCSSCIQAPTADIDSDPSVNNSTKSTKNVTESVIPSQTTILSPGDEYDVQKVG